MEAGRQMDTMVLFNVSLGLAPVASTFTGYASGLEARRSRLPIYLTGMLTSTVILSIQNLDRPTTGFIMVSHQPMIDTAAGIAAYADH
jgi:hypothetical protein